MTIRHAVESEVGLERTETARGQRAREKPQCRVLVVEDEQRIARLLTRALDDCGFATDCVLQGGDALKRLRLWRYDIVVLDLILPDVDGFDALQRIRTLRAGQLVLVLSAVTDVNSKVRCFELGATDYMTKPFVLAELVARIRTRLRDAERDLERDGAADDWYVVNGRLTLDVHHRAAIDGERIVPLSTREFYLLEQLMRRQGRVCTREELLENVWGCAFDPGTNIVDVCVGRLRRKLGNNVIETVRNVGYCYGEPA